MNHIYCYEGQWEMSVAWGGSPKVTPQNVITYLWRRDVIGHLDRSSLSACKTYHTFDSGSLL